MLKFLHDLSIELSKNPHVMSKDEIIDSFANGVVAGAGGGPKAAVTMGFLKLSEEASLRAARASRDMMASLVCDNAASNQKQLEQPQVKPYKFKPKP